MPGQSHLPPNIGGPPNAQADFQSGLPDQFYNKFTDMNVSDAPGGNPVVSTNYWFILILTVV